MVCRMLGTGKAQSISEAVMLGNLLLDQGCIRHVCNEHAFKNKYLFYVFRLEVYVAVVPLPT